MVYFWNVNKRAYFSKGMEFKKEMFIQKLYIVNLIFITAISVYSIVRNPAEEAIEIKELYIFTFHL